MKELEIDCYKNIKEENCGGKTTYLKMYITNVILNINICLSISSELGLAWKFMVLEDSCIYLFFKCLPIYSDSK